MVETGFSTKIDMDTKDTIEPAEFKTLKAATAAYAELAQAKGAVETLHGKATARIAELEGSLSTATADLTQARADLEELRGVMDGRIGELETELGAAQSAATAAESHAAEVVASTGIPAIGNAPDGGSGGKSHTEQFTALTGAAKSLYYAENREAIMREVDAARQAKNAAA